MIENKFIITKKEGKTFSRISGDYNKIHIDEKIGYNSIFGSDICHGMLVVLKFLKKIKFKREQIFNINVKFNKPFFYNSEIIFKRKIIRNNKIEYSLRQYRKETANIVIDFNINNIDKINRYNKTTQYKFNKRQIKKYYKDVEKDLLIVLLNISKYVGMTYPGKNSIINGIDINYNSELNSSKNNIKIQSQLLDKRLPLIKNKLVFKNYLVFFDTAKRPTIKKKKIKLKRNFLRRIKKIKENVFIIGASQGIGRDIFLITQKNKKIIKIASYFRNKIKLKSKNTIIKRINIKKDLRLINNIISKYSPIRIYYFPTTKIFIDNQIDKKTLQEYEEFYILFPLKILKKNKNKKISFFYPSTTHIETYNKAPYSKIKLRAEKIIKNYCEKNQIPAYIHRYPPMNSRQTISLSNNSFPNLAQHLQKDKGSTDKIFPKNILSQLKG